MWRRLKRYVQSAHGASNAASWQAVREIKADVYEGDDERIHELRRLLRQDGSLQANEWDGAQPHHFMHLQAHCLQYFEAQHKQVSKAGVTLLYRLCLGLCGIDCYHAPAKVTGTDGR